MSRGYKLLLFYSGLLIAAFDVHAVASRFFIGSPDAISWSKTCVALLIQAVAVLIAVVYAYWLSSTGRSLLEPETRFWSPGIRIAPMLVAGLLAAFSQQMLFNAWNCGDHPLPTSRGMPTCPR